MISLIFLAAVGSAETLTCGDPGDLTAWCQSQNATLVTGQNMTSCTKEDKLIGASYAFCGRNSTDGIELESLKYLDFRSDSGKPCPFVNNSIGDLYGAKELETVKMASNCECPGKLSVGNETYVPWLKTEHGNDQVSCFGQASFCNHSDGKAFNGYKCPENSNCVDQGPAVFDCQCKDDFGGYRCMEKAGFPYAVVFTVAPVVAVLVAVPVWYVGRRKIIKYDSL